VPEALNLSKESGLDLPFIVVSEKIGEETAVKMMKRTYPDSRKYPRAIVHLKAEYRPLSPRAGAETLKFETQNLNGAGLMFYSDRAIEVETSLEIRLFLTENPINLTARTVWMEKRFDVEKKKEGYAIGLQFVIIRQEDIAIINEYTTMFIGMRPFRPGPNAGQKSMDGK
jgi:c-di-GMP-binding flagellar brake protein YcgR